MISDEKVKNAGCYIFLTIVSVISIFPLYWMIAAATNNSTDILGGKLAIGTNFANNLTKLLNSRMWEGLLEIRCFIPVF